MNNTDHPFSIPKCDAVEQTVRLEKDISAIELEPGENGEAKLGRITPLLRGTKLDICGAGFNDRTVRARAYGRYYFIFRQDIETPQSFSATGL